MLGQRIRQARAVAGLTLEELAQRLGGSPTKQALSQYEHDRRTPDAGTLRRLAHALDVPEPSWFLSSSPATVSWCAYRKTAKLTARRQRAIEGWAERRTEAWVVLRDWFAPQPPPAWPGPIAARTVDDAEAAAEQVRARWGLDDGLVPDLVHLVEDRGAVVLSRDDPYFEGLSGRTSQGLPVLVLQGNSPPDRRRLSLAHELGHLHLDCNDLSAKEQELLAFRFGSALLVPAVVARAELGGRRSRLALHELAALKRKYGLSIQAWLRRARDLAIISETHYVQWQKRISAEGWREQEPCDYEGDEAPSRLEQWVWRALAEGVVTPQWVAARCPEYLADPTLVAPVNDARAIRRLPPDERQQALRMAAEQAAASYRDDPELTAFSALESEPVHDYPDR